MDLPGHGDTRVDAVDIRTTVAALGRRLASFGEPVPLLGYSQGGRIALLTALEHPSLVERLVLISASPGIQDARERTDRRIRDEALAVRIECVGVEAFLDDWLSRPLVGTAHLSADPRHRDRALRSENTASGLATALRGLGQGAQPYVGDRIGELRMPVLTVSGRSDAAYELHAAEMALAARDGRHVSIEGAGHNVVIDAPRALTSAVLEFLDG